MHPPVLAGVCFELDDDARFQSITWEDTLFVVVVVVVVSVLLCDASVKKENLRDEQNKTKILFVLMLGVFFALADVKHNGSSHNTFTEKMG